MSDAFGWSYPAGVTDSTIEEFYGETKCECRECGRTFIPQDEDEMMREECPRCMKLLGAGDTDL